MKNPDMRVQQSSGAVDLKNCDTSALNVVFPDSK